MGQVIDNSDEKKRDCIVECERCGNFLAGKINVAGTIRALGIHTKHYCKGYGFREVKVSEEFTES